MTIRSDSFPLVYAVVLNYNGLKHNVRCLRSLLGQDYPRLRVLFVDNGSADASLSVVRKEFGDSLEYLENGENLLFAAGNNRGIEHSLRAGAECVFVVNNDTDLDEDCLSRLVEFMRQTPGAGGCQPLLRIMDPKGDEGARIASAGIRVSLSGRCWDDRMGEPVGTLSSAPRSVCGITGGGMLLRADALRGVGMFDEGYAMYFEDVDLSFRMLKAGWSLYLVPAAGMSHKVAASTAEHAPLLRIGKCEENGYRLIMDHFPEGVRWRGLLASCCFTVGSLVLNLCRRQWAVAGAIARGGGRGMRYAVSALVRDRGGADDNSSLAGCIEDKTWFPPRI